MVEHTLNMLGTQQRIMVFGSPTPLVEGVSDLLQVEGYQVEVASDWLEADQRAEASLPNLIIVDLSDPLRVSLRLIEQVQCLPHWAGVPILFVSFSGGEQVRELQRQTRNTHWKNRLHFYIHTLLSMDGFLSQVQASFN